MKAILKGIAILLLFVNTFGAFYGSVNLILFPDGSSLKIPAELVDVGPFDDFLIPGIILFVSSGLFGLLVLFAIFVKLKNRWLFLFFQGVLLSGWILTEVFIIQSLNELQLFFGLIGIYFLVVGFLFMKSQKDEEIESNYYKHKLF